MTKKRNSHLDDLITTANLIDIEGIQQRKENLTPVSILLPVQTASPVQEEEDVTTPAQPVAPIQKEDDGIQEEKHVIYAPTLSKSREEPPPMKTIQITKTNHERIKLVSEANGCTMTDLVHNIIERWWLNDKEWILADMAKAAANRMKEIS